MLASARPLVSVIIPAYKGKDLILETLTSVRQQTYPAWEIIVVDDASQDGTAEIVQEFARSIKDHRVECICHPHNYGVSQARNTGIAQAQGEYLAFLDHDDLWRDHHLETAVSQLEAANADLVYSTVQLFEHQTYRDLGHYGPDDQELADFPTSLLARNYIQPSAVVLRRSLLEKVGKFDAQFQSAEDLDYWFRSIAAGGKFIYLPGVYALYRKHLPTAATANTIAVLEQQTLVLRKHRSLKGVSPLARNMIITRFHLGVARRSLKQNSRKAANFFFWAWRISPLGTCAALISTVRESIGLKSKRDRYKL